MRARVWSIECWLLGVAAFPSAVGVQLIGHPAAGAQGTRQLLAGQLWLDNIARPSVRATTWDGYELAVRLHLKTRSIAGYKLSDLRPKHASGPSSPIWTRRASRAATHRRSARFLRPLLSKPSAMVLIPSCPTRNVDKPQPQEEEIIPFTPEEARMVLTAACGAHFIPREHGSSARPPARRCPVEVEKKAERWR